MVRRVTLLGSFCSPYRPPKAAIAFKVSLYVSPADLLNGSFMTGALDLTEPRHLFAKLSYEIDLLTAEPRNSYAAMNALRDAYHLGDWIWHSRLKNDRALRAAIMGAAGNEKAWYRFLRSQFADFILIGELCNGSKHFEAKPGGQVQSTHTAGYGSPLFAYNVGPLGYGVDGLFVVLDGGRIVSVTHLLQSVRTFWSDLFAHFPQL
jgi:hypothetical protein